MKKFAPIAAGACLVIILLAVALVGVLWRYKEHRISSPAAAGASAPPAWRGDPEARFRELGLPAPDAPIASFAGQQIPFRDFYRLLIQGYGKDILTQQIRDMLIHQEIARRGIVVPDADVEELVKQARGAVKRESQANKTFEGLLAERHWDIQQFKQEAKDQLALEQMIRRDLQLPESAAIQDDQVNQWGKGLRRRAKIRGRREGLRPGVAAVVNGDEIPEADIVKELADRVPRADLEKLVEGLLDDRIVEKLMQDRHIQINDADINAMTQGLENEVHKRPGMAGVALENYLSASNKTLADLQEQFRHAIGLRKIVEKEITEAQVRAAFADLQDAYSGKTVHAEHILALAVDVGTMQPRDETAFERARAKIENIQRQIKDGASFEEMARKESDDPGTAKSGGDLGFIRRLGDVSEEVAAMAFLLQPNEISSPVRSAYGYHLIRVLEIRPGKPVRFEDVKQQVRVDLVVAACDRWLVNYKRRLAIVRNLGAMGRTVVPAATPARRPATATGR